MLPNLPQMVIAFYNAQLGAIVVNTNPTYTSREIEQRLRMPVQKPSCCYSSLYGKLQAVRRAAIKRVIIADVPDYVPMPWKALVKSSVRSRGRWWTWRKAASTTFGSCWTRSGGPPQVDIASDEVALFSIPAARPACRAAMLTHFNMVANTIQVRQWLRNIKEGKDCMLSDPSSTFMA